MAKKEGHAYHKPKPRVAVYVGLAGSGAVAAGADGSGTVPFNILDNIKTKQGLQASLGNLSAIATDMGTAAKVAVPAVLGIVVSVGADKLGVNKVLAKMKAPFRV